MRINPKSEREVEELSCRPRGIYDYEVLDAEEQVSGKGNDMIVVNLKLEGSDGVSFRLKDYLIATDTMAYKVRHFAQSAGVLEQYEAGEMHATSLRGLTGRCKVGIEPAKGDFPAKNKVADYVSGTTSAPRIDHQAPPTKQLEDDEIPF